MNKGILFYPKMAAANIQKNGRSYFPYILTCTLTAAMYFIICALADNPGIENLWGGTHVRYCLNMGTGVTAVFAVIFLFYTNSFLIKRRKKEFALYNILGLEKRHLGRILFCETVDVAFLSLGFGILFGVLLSKLLFLLLLRMFGTTTPIRFVFSAGAVGKTCILFLVIDLLIFLNSIRQIQFKSPMELLQEGRAGEREPKTRRLLALAGVLLLSAGYYMAVTIENPVAALALFFVAVILVILGTYCLFTAGSVALLKLLRRKKKYYYQANHFISVSGMLYRMKQNAVGLANICVLSTMVLVMLASSFCLYAGMDSMLKNRYPRDLMISAPGLSTEAEAFVTGQTEALLAEQGIAAEDTIRYHYLTFAAVERDGVMEAGGEENLMDMNRLRQIYLVTLADYNAMTGENETLEPGEILFHGSYRKDSVTMFDTEYRIKRKVTDFLKGAGSISETAKRYTVVVADEAALQLLKEQQGAVYGEHASEKEFVYGFNMAADAETQIAMSQELSARLSADGAGNALPVSVNSRKWQEQYDTGLFGGLFFIGIFLGLLFLMAAVLIIYYKQVSEGYEDKERFAILKKVGMGQREIKRSIHSQVLTVFFLPLLGAVVHMAFAFPFVLRVLSLFGMTDKSFFALCTAGTLGIFAVFYLAVYQATAKVYDKIVG